MHDNEGKKRLGETLQMFFDALKTYGKQPAQMENVAKLFQFALADYSYDQIRKAFAQYVKTSSEMPAPADIVNIIERNGKPPFEKAVYIAIQKKYAGDRTDSDWQYLREYENYITKGE